MALPSRLAAVAAVVGVEGELFRGGLAWWIVGAYLLGPGMLAAAMVAHGHPSD